MAIVQELNESYFMDRFKEMGRGDQFSYDALSALYDYYDNLSDDIGEDIKLDVIGICCDWSESTIDQLYIEYPASLDAKQIISDENATTPDDVAEALHDAALAFLQDKTIVIELNNGSLLYQAF
jgi:hypothetical protein